MADTKLKTLTDAFVTAVEAEDYTTAPIKARAARSQLPVTPDSEIEGTRLEWRNRIEGAIKELNSIRCQAKGTQRTKISWKRTDEVELDC